MKFNLGELESLFYEIQEIIEYIEVSKFEGRKFSLYLSNGEVINYKMFKDNVPHLLGININALISTGVFKNKSAFEVLKEMVDNAYTINKLYQEGIINYDNIFSKHIFDKLKIFKNNISPNIYETEFICKYNSSRSYNVSTKNEKYDYLIVKKIQNTDSYAVLCLIENDKYYKPMSSKYFVDRQSMIEGLKEFIENQEITLFNGVRCVGNNGEYRREYNLKPDMILPKLKMLLEDKKIFNSIVDTTSGYIFSISETLKHITNNVYEKNFDNEEVREKYSNIKDERDNLKIELEQLRKECLEMKKVKEELVVSNNKLIEENEAYKAREENIIKILRPSVK